MISPATISLPNSRLQLSTKIAYSRLDQFTDTEWSDRTSDEWLACLLVDIGLAKNCRDYELAVFFGGTVKVIPSSEKPYAMVEDLAKYELRPQLLVRRRISQTECASRVFNGGAVTVSPTTITFVDSPHA